MQLDKELEKLNILLLKMADTVQDNILHSFEAYKQGSNEGININDDIVDTYERLIEETCLDILIRERLYAKDLRKVTGILKMIVDLERIGDHAIDILEFNQKLQDYERLKVDQIEEILNTALSMVNDSIASFVREDLSLAHEVIERDTIVDNGYESLVKYLIENDDKSIISSAFAIYTTLVIKYIERIADHAVNIAEWVVYISSGVHKDRRIF